MSADYDNIVSEILDTCHTTDKQAAVAGLILLADKLACECIFTDETPLSAADISEFTKNDEEVSTSGRAYDYIVGWIATNNERFTGGAYGETWGSTLGRSVYVIDSILQEALESKNFSFDAVKRDWADNGWLEKYRNKFKKRKAINGTLTYCVEIILPNEDR